MNRSSKRTFPPRTRHSDNWMCTVWPRHHPTDMQYWLCKYSQVSFYCLIGCVARHPSGNSVMSQFHILNPNPPNAVKESKYWLLLWDRTWGHLHLKQVFVSDMVASVGNVNKIWSKEQQIRESFTLGCLMLIRIL